MNTNRKTEKGFKDNNAISIYLLVFVREGFCNLGRIFPTPISKIAKTKQEFCSKAHLAPDLLDIINDSTDRQNNPDFKVCQVCSSRYY